MEDDDSCYGNLPEMVSIKNIIKFNAVVWYLINLHSYGIVTPTGRTIR